ncbi:glycoside hydrolase [Fomitiporia mediterranea MF3/22]|uniref:glycoside hydrolase n=1 Tax=Fomitiporia mediterranea (strain MF3/22) TaxID=694068 RepID=UPI0004408E72|nr:glycoside hydrolase [Fomitiporia mediterranea MF3/22]EJD05843.1 glycoside hydrolase [Fomitiporia mediterranea MF3/22]
MAVTNNHIFSSDGSCDVQAYNPAPVLSQTFPPFDLAKANIFRYRQQQSVNLGSWYVFVHENWMTPSLFRCASGPKSAEIDIATGWGNTTGARAVLEHHWDTFITQSDFQYLASIGINTVRLPIGFWNLGPTYCQGTPFESVAEVYTNSWSRVVRAINWAGEAGIGVLVDLHGAVGSQNGQAHSGVSDGQANFFSNPSNQDATINVLTFLAQQLASVTNVIGIEILNEPNDDESLPNFYDRAIPAIHQASPAAATLPLYIHDAFNLDRYADYVANRTDFLVEDHHSYFVFDSYDDSQSADQDTKHVETTISDQLSSASQKTRRNLIVGEWSCALVADALKGEKDPKASRQQFCQGQQQVYANTTAGWHFWSYMKESCDTDEDWCFKNAVGNTLPSNFFAYNSTSSASGSKAMYLSRAVADMKLPSMSEVLLQANDRSSSSLSASSQDTSLSASGDGYSDGFLTAKIFAQHGMSKLGFTGQYKTDSIAKLSPEIVAPGSEDFYSEWFDRGLKDGEDAVSKAASI